jgi:putative restriction endonuclease
MANGVFLHRSDTRYQDVPARHYQFPKQYKSRVDQCVGDWVLYLEPSKVPQTRGYFAIAKIQTVIEDPNHPGMFIALVEPNSYLEFGEPVPFNGPFGIVEHSVLNKQRRISGRAQSAVRVIPIEDFARIVDLGLAEDETLPRQDPDALLNALQDAEVPFEFDMPAARRIEQQLMSRKVRDRNFRKIVLRAYDERCAMTGLKLINGGGRAEVEAAHIRPVEHDGPDVISNGIALSGTVHWMFDRGLVGVDVDNTVLISRQVNDLKAVTGLINRDRRLLLPKDRRALPHPAFLRWHREHCFKH